MVPPGPCSSRRSSTSPRTSATPWPRNGFATGSRSQRPASPHRADDVAVRGRGRPRPRSTAPRRRGVRVRVLDAVGHQYLHGVLDGHPVDRPQPQPLEPRRDLLPVGVRRDRLLGWTGRRIRDQRVRPWTRCAASRVMSSAYPVRRRPGPSARARTPARRSGRWPRRTGVPGRRGRTRRPSAPGRACFVLTDVPGQLDDPVGVEQQQVNRLERVGPRGRARSWRAGRRRWAPDSGSRPRRRRPAAAGGRRCSTPRVPVRGSSRARQTVAECDSAGPARSGRGRRGRRSRARRRAGSWSTARGRPSRPEAATPWPTTSPAISATVLSGRVTASNQSPPAVVSGRPAGSSPPPRRPARRAGRPAAARPGATRPDWG